MNKKTTYNWEMIMMLTVVLLMVAVFWYGVFRLAKDVAGASDVGLGATVRWNCTNMQNTQHPLPVTINTDDNGNWDVLLEDYSVLHGTRLEGGFMKWVWQDAWWLTDGYNVVYCESDVKAMSILLAQ